VADPVNLTQGVSGLLDGTGAAELSIGPDSGPANWRVTSVIVQTDRPGQAPIPRVQLYLDTVAPTNSIGIGYDGSFGQFVGEQVLSRGQHIIAVWTGGQAGDQATVTVNGEKW
jgi:hypothetical protein